MKKMKLKRFLVSIILIIVTFTSFTCFGNCADKPTDTQEPNIEYTDTYSLLANYTGKQDSIQYVVISQQKNDVKKELVAEVNKYIKRKAPNAYANISEHIVTKCLENNIDICFAMSQTQIETNFGTTGAGRVTSRRSMFGVAKRYYQSYESAISDYVAILKKSYLVRGKTERDLMNNYVTIGGTRYASNTGYETDLKKIYAEIKNSTNIYKLQKHYLTM